MPALDKTLSQGLNLEDPAPTGRSVISRRLLYTGWALAIGIGLVIVGGLSLRLVRKDNAEKVNRTSRIASEAAASNRPSVEKQQSTGQDETKPLQSVAQAQPEKAAPSPASGSDSGTTHPELAHQPDSFREAQAQQALEQQAELEAQRQAYQEEIAARKAPTSYQAYLALANTPGRTEGGQGNILPASPASPAPPPEQLMAMSHPGSGDSLAGLKKILGLNQARNDAYDAQNAQDDKARFAAASPDAPNPAEDYLKATRVDPLSEFEIQQGSVIPAAIPLGINSDTPGHVTAEVRVDVNDALCGVIRKDGLTHCYVLIPHGAKLIGEYNSNLSYGQNRLQVVWTRVIFPDTTSLDLGRMNGHSADGAAGLTGKTNNHWGGKLASAALTAALSASVAVTQNGANGSVLQYPSTGTVIGASVGQSASQLGQQVTQRNFDRQPTLIIPPGQKFVVYVNKDIVFPGPYEPHY